MEKRPAFAHIICPSFQTIRFIGEEGSGFFQQGFYEDLANPWRSTSSNHSDSRWWPVPGGTRLLGWGCGGQAGWWQGLLLGLASPWRPCGVEGSPGSSPPSGRVLLWLCDDSVDKWEELVQPVPLAPSCRPRGGSASSRPEIQNCC